MLENDFLDGLPMRAGLAYLSSRHSMQRLCASARPLRGGQERSSLPEGDFAPRGTGAQQISSLSAR